MGKAGWRRDPARLQGGPPSRRPGPHPASSLVSAAPLPPLAGDRYSLISTLDSMWYLRRGSRGVWTTVGRAVPPPALALRATWAGTMHRRAAATWLPLLTSRRAAPWSRRENGAARGRE